MSRLNNTDFIKTKKTGFTSELDQFFHDFDKNRAGFPDSRLAEISKHKKIADKRDKA